MADADDELLALAYDNDTESNSKKRKSSTNGRTPNAKRRKANDTTDDDMESEEDDSNPYPLEGKYKDDDDRDRLLDMSELEREEILAQRLEEQQRLKDKINLQRMQRMSSGLMAQDDDSVSKAAKRKHIAPGTSQTKAKKLDELKEKRKQSAIKAAQPKTESARKALSSSSGSDMEESDEEGQVTKSDEEEARYRSAAKKPVDETISKEDLDKVRLSRDLLEKWCHAPFFEEAIKGLWVRLMLGPDKDDGRPVYRVCEVIGLTPESAKTYKVENILYNRQLELKHGESVKPFGVDRISNGAFTDREFDRLVAVFKQEKQKLPTKRSVDTKAADLRKYQNRTFTDSEISAIIAYKQRLSGKINVQAQLSEKSFLHQQRSLALKRHDHAEVTRLDGIIAEMEMRVGTPDSGTEDKLRKVNERNRKANLEQIRKAEAAEAEERRRHGGLTLKVRKLHSTGNTPLLAPQESTADTVQPLALDGGGLLTPLTDDSPRGPSPGPSSLRVESKIATAIDLDLGDF